MTVMSFRYMIRSLEGMQPIGSVSDAPVAVQLGDGTYHRISSLPVLGDLVRVSWTVPDMSPGRFPGKRFEESGVCLGCFIPDGIIHDSARTPVIILRGPNGLVCYQLRRVTVDAVAHP